MGALVALLAVLRALVYACCHHGPCCAPVVVRDELRCACEFGHRRRVP
jgi:hypothetical protein